MRLIKINSQLPQNNDRLNHFSGRDFFIEPEHYFSEHRQNQVRVNIKEASDNYRIEIAAPGYDKKDFNVEINNNILTISTNKSNEAENENNKYSHREFSYGTFKRSFTLPKGKIQDSKINAQYQNGILSIAIPKTEEAKPKPKRILEIN